MFLNKIYLFSKTWLIFLIQEAIFTWLSFSLLYFHWLNCQLHSLCNSDMLLFLNFSSKWESEIFVCIWGGVYETNKHALQRPWSILLFLAPKTSSHFLERTTDWINGLSQINILIEDTNFIFFFINQKFFYPGKIVINLNNQKNFIVSKIYNW